MKKFIFIMPLMAVSLLASCGSKTPVEHFVTFESYGGGHFPTQRVKDGETATPPTEEPIRGEDQFLGWFTDFDQPAYTFKEKVTDDITLYAGWEVAPDPATSFRFKFTGHDCKVNGLTSFECNIDIEAQTQFAIIPDGARSFPPKDDQHWIVKKGEGTFTYEPSTGYIKIGSMTSDIEIEAFASGPATKYNISFTGSDCKAKGESITAASKSFQIENVPGGQEYSFTIEPNSDFALDGSIDTFLVNGSPSTAYQYTIGEGGKYNLSFTLTGNTLISIAANPVTYKRHVSFNISNCTMKWGTTEITSTGVDIPVLDTNPYYVKFSVKASDSIYMKPRTLSLNSGAYTDYFFNKDNGDLFVNLQEDIIVTGLCDIYKSLEEMSWAQIAGISESEKADKAFNIGDTKTVKVNNQDHKIRIIGFNHDALKSDKTKTAGITFEFANVITNSDGNADTTYWNYKSETSSTNYKYSESTFNDYLNVGENCIFKKLPDELKADGIIKEVYKPVAEGSSYEISDTYTTKLFPLSYREITAKGTDSFAKKEGSAYPFYTGEGYDTDDNRIKRKSGIDTGNGEFYWLRSPNASNSSIAWRVGVSGSFGSMLVYSVAFAVAPAFCI